MCTAFTIITEPRINTWIDYSNLIYAALASLAIALGFLIFRRRGRQSYLGFIFSGITIVLFAIILMLFFIESGNRPIE